MPDNLLILAAIILAVLAAILAFFFDVDVRTVLGLDSAALACGYAAGYTRP